jgi:hypothetical protein
MSQTWTVKDSNTAKFFIAYIEDQVEQGVDRVYAIQKMDRTYRQNNALHLLLRRMANDLNDAGIDYPHPLNPEFRMQWNELRVKTLLLVPYCEWMFKTEHTSHLNTEQFAELLDAFVDGVNQATGVYTPIPSQEFTNAPS